MRIITGELTPTQPITCTPWPVKLPELTMPLSTTVCDGPQKKVSPAGVANVFTEKRPETWIPFSIPVKAPIPREAELE